MDAFKYARISRFPCVGLERKGSEGNRISLSINLQDQMRLVFTTLREGRDLSKRQST